MLALIVIFEQAHQGDKEAIVVGKNHKSVQLGLYVANGGETEGRVRGSGRERKRGREIERWRGSCFRPLELLCLREVERGSAEAKKASGGLEMVAGAWRRGERAIRSVGRRRIT